MAMSISLEISESDFPAIVKLQNKLFPKVKWWTVDQAKAQFLDLARGKGKHVVKVIEDNGIKGIAGWVSEPKTHEFYGAPFIAASADAALLIIKELVEQAKRSKAYFIRIGSYQYESKKNEALLASGFKAAFDFIELEISPKNVQTKNISDFKFIEAGNVVPSKYRDLYNLSFKDVANAPPVNEAKAAELWTAPDIDRRLSGAWENDRGEYVAFILIHNDGYLDSIGVHPSYQKQGLGSLIYESIFNKASSLGVKILRVTVADNNEASLKLHRRYGFVEIERRQVWQLDLSN